MSNSNPTHPPPPTAIPLPLHAVGRDADGAPLVVKRRPGRPRVVRPQPAADEADYVRQVNEARAAHVDADVLVGTLRGRADADQVLGAVIEGLARESASLAWEITQGRQAGRDTSQLSSRRIDGLQKIALLELGRRKLGLGDELGPKIHA